MTRIRGAYRHLAVISLALILLMPISAGAAKGRLEVKAYGSAINSGNSGKTREAALDEAIRDAVSTAVKDYLALHGIEADEQALATGIYSHAASFVLNYKILSERWISETPDLGLEGAEGGLDSGTTPGSDKKANEALAPPGPPAPPKPPTYHVLINATLDMGAIRKAVIRVMGAEKSGLMRLVMLDISDYETFRALMASLKRISVIEEISYDSFTRDRFVATVRTVMDPATLAGEIGREAGPDFVAAAYGVNTIIIKAFPGPGAP